MNEPLQTGARISGDFELESGRSIFGELSVEGKDTSLYLRDRAFFHTLDLADGYLKGTAHDLSRLSLIDCITLSGLGSGSRGEESYTFAEVFPHHIVHGAAHLHPKDECISAIFFSIDDGRAAFYDFDSYGVVIDPEKLIGKVANANRGITGRRAPIGPYPQISYFGGRKDLLETTSVIGTVEVRNLPGHRQAGRSDNASAHRVGFKIKFEKPVDFHEARTRAETLTRFFNLVIGRPQNRENVTLSTVDANSSPQFLQVYSTMCDRWHHSKEKRQPGPRDVLIEGVSSMREMRTVLERWLALDAARRDARLRFAHVFEEGHRFSEDRLIGAANMFDLLPADAVPRDTRLSKRILKARDTARALFEALDDSPERDSVLGALGRVGKSSLRRKIAHRAKIVTRQLPLLEPDMAFVIREAVLCRNHYVHGSAGSIDYRAGGTFAFLTRALEFIFGASDLIECGWKLRRYAESGGGDHPFAQLLQTWSQEVAALKTEIAARGR